MSLMLELVWPTPVNPLPRSPLTGSEPSRLLPLSRASPRPPLIPISTDGCAIPSDHETMQNNAAPTTATQPLRNEHTAHPLSDCGAMCRLTPLRGLIERGR